MTEILVVKISMVSYLYLGILCKIEPTRIQKYLNFIQGIKSKTFQLGVLSLLTEYLANVF